LGEWEIRVVDLEFVVVVDVKHKGVCKINP
jgi:hypothetical protein